MRKNFTIICLIAIMISGVSLTGNAQFQKTINLGGDSYANAGAVDANGNNYYVGTTFANGATSGDAFVLKTDGSGNPIWVKQYGGSSTDWGTFIISTNDGNLLLAGRSNSYSSSMDMFVAKVDTNGGLIWAKTFGTDSTDYAVKIAEGPNGYLVTGSTRGGDSATANRTDVLLVLLDANGAEKWTKIMGMQYINENVYDVISINNDGYVVAGNSGANIFGANEGMFAVIDTGGNMQATFLSGDVGEDDFRAIVAGTDGDESVYFIGNTYPGGGQQSEMWVTRWSVASGPPVIQWSKTFGGPQNESLSAAKQIPDGSGMMLLLGHTSSFGAGGDAEVMLIDTNGNIILSKNAGGTGDEYFQNGNFTNNGALFVGYTNSFGGSYNNVWLVAPDETGSTACASESNAATATTINDTSAFYNMNLYPVTLNVTTQTISPVSGTTVLTSICDTANAINDLENQINFTLFPNPSSALVQLTMNTDKSGLAAINLYDVAGRLVRSVNTKVTSGANTISLDVSSLQSGTYMVQVSEDNGRKKAVKLLSVE